MQYFKLQIGSMIIILYVIVVYVRATKNSDVRCNKLFDRLMMVAPWAVFFDGLTAWTVNHQDMVPAAFNLFAHIMFFLCMDVAVLIVATYMYQQLVGDEGESLLKNILLSIPGLLSIALIFVGANSVEYIEGVHTNYSMGLSVYACYCSVLFHYSFIMFLMISRHRYLPKRKKFGIFSFIILTGIVLIIQVIFPEVLLTSICSSILLLGIYIEFEDPAIQRLTMINSKMVRSFATLVESRDNATGGHVKRTQEYVELMLRQMRKQKQYRKIINKDYMEYVSNVAPLHDIGKISTPDEILQKPGKLTKEEFDIMKEHAARGGEIINEIFSELNDPDFQKIAYEMARYHHEKYNGKGYPSGLSGEEIPLHARIMAIADVFDALSQDRCYKKAFPVDKCFAIIEEGAGSDFDPELVELFLASREEVIELMM